MSDWVRAHSCICVVIVCYHTKQCNTILNRLCVIMLHRNIVTCAVDITRVDGATDRLERGG